MTRGVIIAMEDNDGWDLPLLPVPPSPSMEMPTTMRVVNYVTSAVVITLAVVAVAVLILAIALVVDCCLPSSPDEDHRLPLGGEGLHEDIGRCRHRRGPSPPCCRTATAFTAKPLPCCCRYLRVAANTTAAARYRAATTFTAKPPPYCRRYLHAAANTTAAVRCHTATAFTAKAPPCCHRYLCAAANTTAAMCCRTTTAFTVKAPLCCSRYLRAAANTTTAVLLPSFLLSS